MLCYLHIHNFAIIQHIEIDFQSHLSVLTGETGAGKSILIDAIGLILGDRANLKMLRKNCKRADIFAGFSLQHQLAIQDWLTQQQLTDEASPATCIIRRTIQSGGGSKAYINNFPVSLQLVKELGEKLVNIHGQHTHQLLSKSVYQRQLLDTFAQHDTLLHQVQHSYQTLLQLQEQYTHLQTQQEHRQQRYALLEFQLEELATLNPQENELSQLEEEYRILSHSQQLQAGVENVQQLLHGEQQSIQYALYQCQKELESLTQIDTRLHSTVELLNQAIIQTEEAENELNYYLQHTEVDPVQLQYLEERLNHHYRLAKKHLVDTDKLPALYQNLQQELHSLSHSEEELIQLEQQIEQATKEYYHRAKKLTQSRQHFAQQLQDAVMQHLQHIGMPHARFQIQFRAKSIPHHNGMDDIIFYIATNPGQDMGKLSEIASGGELSRISLAIAVSTAGCHHTPTLIFDEIDVGIGGGVAEQVGKMLRLLAQQTQVFCITHQAQVASQAQQHFKVAKRTHHAVTQTQINALSSSQRTEEIARMLGGLEITQQTRFHAQEMLDRAQNKHLNIG